MLLIKKDDFFAKLHKLGLKTRPQSHDNLIQFLKIDNQYPNLLYLRKIVRAIELFNSNGYFNSVGMKVRCFYFNKMDFRGCSFRQHQPFPQREIALMERLKYNNNWRKRRRNRSRRKKRNMSTTRRKDSRSNHLSFKKIRKRRKGALFNSQSLNFKKNLNTCQCILCLIIHLNRLQWLLPLLLRFISNLSCHLRRWKFQT